MSSAHPPWFFFPFTAKLLKELWWMDIRGIWMDIHSSNSSPSSLSSAHSKLASLSLIPCSKKLARWRSPKISLSLNPVDHFQSLILCDLVLCDTMGHSSFGFPNIQPSGCTSSPSPCYLLITFRSCIPRYQVLGASEFFPWISPDLEHSYSATHLWSHLYLKTATCVFWVQTYLWSSRSISSCPLSVSRYCPTKSPNSIHTQLNLTSFPLQLASFLVFQLSIWHHSMYCPARNIKIIYIFN